MLQLLIIGKILLSVLLVSYSASTAVNVARGHEVRGIVLLSIACLIVGWVALFFPKVFGL